MTRRGWERPTLEIETMWGTHTVVQRGDRWIAESFGAGGARGYRRWFDSREAAEDYVRTRTRTRDDERAIKF